jgi:hypothetical protein
MAEIPPIKIPTGDILSKKDNVFGEKSGVDLTKSVNLNSNPFQISGLFLGEKFIDVSPDSSLYANTAGWNAFQNFLTAKGIVKDPSNNSEENKKLANELIIEFNSGTAKINEKTFDHVVKYPFNKITTKQIIFTQTYHKIVDPKVQIDGWVGSQTSQLRYPTILGAYTPTPGDATMPAKKTGFIPIIWGNKRFVTKIEDQITNSKNTKTQLPPKSLWIIYDENLHKATLDLTRIGKEWYLLDQSLEITKSASQLNIITAQTNKIKENFKTQSSIINSILPKG